MMRLFILAILAGLAFTSSAAAAPRKVLVLPLDGDVEPDTRAKYSAAVQRLARKLDGKVTAGDVTFTDTATAIGCDPRQPKCAEDVRATLGVDELIYGTAKNQDGKVVLVVRRVAKGQAPREASATLEATDSPDRAESEMAPLFQGPTEGPKDGDGKDGDQGPTDPPPRPPIRRAKVLGYTAIAGGGALLLISFALWSSASGLEDDIDAHPVEDYGDFQNLRDLEDKARARAWTGNALFVAGLAVGGLGGWILYRDRKAQEAVVAPAPVPGGAAIVLRGAF